MAAYPWRPALEEFHICYSNVAEPHLQQRRGTRPQTKCIGLIADFNCIDKGADTPFFRESKDVPGVACIAGRLPGTEAVFERSFRILGECRQRHLAVNRLINGFWNICMIDPNRKLASIPEADARH